MKLDRNDLFVGLIAGGLFGWLTQPGGANGLPSPWEIGLGLMPFSALLAFLFMVPALIRGEAALLIAVLASLFTSVWFGGFVGAAFQLIVAVMPAVFLSYWLARLISNARTLHASLWTGSLVVLIPAVYCAALFDSVLLYDLLISSDQPPFYAQMLIEGQQIVNFMIDNLNTSGAGLAGLSDSAALDWPNLSKGEVDRDYFYIKMADSLTLVTYAQLYSSSLAVTYLPALAALVLSAYIVRFFRPGTCQVPSLVWMVLPGRFVLPLLFVLSFFLSSTGGSLGLFGLLVNSGLSMVYLTNGLGYLHFALRNRKNRLPFLVLGYSLIFLLFPIATFVLLIAGLGEQILQLRWRQLMANHPPKNPPR